MAPFKAQYMCTEIGDISDEGKAKSMTDQEVGSMESLLGKLGIEDNNTEAPINEEKGDKQD